MSARVLNCNMAGPHCRIKCLTMVAAILTRIMCMRIPAQCQVVRRFGELQQGHYRLKWVMRARAGQQHSECRVRESRSRESRRSTVEGLSPLRNDVEESPSVVSVDFVLIHLHPVVPLPPKTTCFSFSCNPLSDTSTVQCKGGFHIVTARGRSDIDYAFSNPFAIQNGGISNLSTVVQRHRYYRTIGNPWQVVRGSLKDLLLSSRSH
jgi:hypothetical protein